MREIISFSVKPKNKELIKWLKQRHEATGISISFMIVEALKLYKEKVDG